MSVELSAVIPDFTSPNSIGRPSVQFRDSPEGAGSRASTIASRYQAVEQVILAMRERLNEPLSLQTMAEIALLSPYHFNRVFRYITGITPCRFLTVLRMEAAKQLLMTTKSTVSDVCFGVGFNSLGSFTRDFTQYVGLSPSGLRRLTRNTRISYFELIRDYQADSYYGAAPDTGLTGQISAPDDFVGLVFVGAFATPFPQGRPLTCTLLSAAGTYHMAHVPDGDYYLFAAALPRSEEPLAYLLPDQTKLYIGASRVRTDRNTITGETNMMLRSPQLTDPPILVALPLLAAERLSIRETITA